MINYIYEYIYTQRLIISQGTRGSARHQTENRGKDFNLNWILLWISRLLNRLREISFSACWTYRRPINFGMSVTYKSVYMLSIFVLLIVHRVICLTNETLAKDKDTNYYYASHCELQGWEQYESCPIFAERIILLLDNAAIHDLNFITFWNFQKSNWNRLPDTILSVSFNLTISV